MLSAVSKIDPDIIAKITALDPEKRRCVPLRLAVAARLAFPDGTMGASGLRNERDKGRLDTEMIAGKEYTTLTAIERMRELCRVQKPQISRQNRPSTNDSGITAQEAVRIMLQKRRERR
jgi:hypothetical protein